MLIHENIINIAFFTCKYEGALLWSLGTSSVDRNVEAHKERQWKSPGVSQFCLPASKEPCGVSTSSFDDYLKTTTSTVNSWTSLFDPIQDNLESVGDPRFVALWTLGLFKQNLAGSKMLLSGQVPFVACVRSQFPRLSSPQCTKIKTVPICTS